MFFFFVGGLEQEAGRVIKEKAGRCIRCGSYADLVAYEKVLKLFFIPVWRRPGKEPAMYCRNCNFLFPQSFSLPPSPEDSTIGAGDPPPSLGDALRCRNCACRVYSSFRFCPFCGSAL